MHSAGRRGVAHLNTVSAEDCDNLRSRCVFGGSALVSLADVCAAKGVESPSDAQPFFAYVVDRNSRLSTNTFNIGMTVSQLEKKTNNLGMQAARAARKHRLNSRFATARSNTGAERPKSPERDTTDQDANPMSNFMVSSLYFIIGGWI